jgi:hypothetical protein
MVGLRFVFEEQVRQAVASADASATDRLQWTGKQTLTKFFYPVFLSSLPSSDKAYASCKACSDQTERVIGTIYIRSL